MYKASISISNIEWSYNTNNEETPYSMAVYNPDCSSIVFTNLCENSIFFYNESYIYGALESLGYQPTPYYELKPNEVLEFKNTPDCHILQSFTLYNNYEGEVFNKVEIRVITYQLM